MHVCHSITRPIDYFLADRLNPERMASMRRRYTDQDLIAAVRSSFAIARVLKLLRLSPTGATYKGMRAHFARLGLDTSHFTGQGHLRGKHHSWKPGRPLGEVLVQNSRYTKTSALKRRLIRGGLLVNQC